MALNGKYLQEAEKLLEQGDYSQASEKFWGAVATALKAVATARRWRHYTHRDLLVVVRRLYEETKDPEIPRLFSSAESLHANCYEDYASEQLLRLHAEDARRLVAKLQALAE